MNSKKTTPEGLYLKDLRKSSKYKSFDNASASSLFKTLSLDERERYILLSRRMNESIAARNAGTYTTQRDTIGSDLKEVSEFKRRRTKWEGDVIGIIKNIAENDNVMEKEFVVVQVSGVYFARPNDSQSGYAIGEITFEKFSFKNGIIDSLVLFPDCLKIAIGYRESLYEDLEEAVGWRPDTFKNNCTLEDCSKRIRVFFSGVYEPIYVSSQDQMQEVGMSLYNLYSEIGQRCPWLHSLLDWGQYCTIYRLDDLVMNILNKKNPSDKPHEALSCADVRDHWLQMNKNMASQCCERHQQYGLPNQCPHDILLKNLYGTFLLVNPLYKDEMRDIRDIVSKEFFNNLDFVLEPEPLPSTTTYDHPQIQSNRHWINYVFDESGIEDIINRIEAVSLNNNSLGSKGCTDRLPMNAPIMSGRGRGSVKHPAKCVTPGQETSSRKIKLPNVVC